MQNNGHTGGNQPVLTPVVPTAAVAPLIENIAQKYGDLKRTVHDYILSLDDDDHAWKNGYLALLSEMVGLSGNSQVGKMESDDDR